MTHHIEDMMAENCPVREYVAVEVARLLSDATCKDFCDICCVKQLLILANVLSVRVLSGEETLAAINVAAEIINRLQDVPANDADEYISAYLRSFSSDEGARH